MLIAYPLLTVVDDSGAVVSGATVTVASVKDLDGADVSAPGATVHQSGPNVAVTYDAEAKGEAWVTLSISKNGSTFTGLNAAPSFFLSRDPSRIEANLDAQVSTRYPSSAAAALAPFLLPGVVSSAAGAGSITVDLSPATPAQLELVGSACRVAYSDGGVASSPVSGALHISGSLYSLTFDDPFPAAPAAGDAVLIL